MMRMLRSRKFLLILTGLICLGIVGSYGLGALRIGQPAPPAPQQGAQQQGGQEQQAPDANQLGDAPEQVQYADLGEQCYNNGECVRVVGLRSDELSGEEVLEQTFSRLLDQGYIQITKDGQVEDTEEDGPESLTYTLTNGKFIVQSSEQTFNSDNAESKAGLIIARGKPPQESPSP